MDDNMTSRSSSDSSASSRSSYFSTYSDSSYCSTCDYDSASSSSSMATPQKKGAMNVKHQTRDNMFEPMKWDFDNLIHSNYDLEKFLQIVFGVSGGADFRAKDCSLDTTHLAAYEALVTLGADEKMRYSPFEGIITNLISKLKLSNLYFEMKGTKHFKNQYTSRAPDGFASWKPLDKPSWDHIKAAWEMKCNRDYSRGRAAKASKKVSKQKPPTKRTKGSKAGTRSNPASGPSTHTVPSNQSFAGAASAFPSTSNLSMNPSATTLASDATTGKRPRDENDAGDEHPGKKLKSDTGLVKKTYQVGLYALECLASACRRWTIGFMIDEFNITVWYFDRIGAVRTEPFDFKAEPWKLAMVLTGLAQCTPAQAGFEPLILAPGTPLAAPAAAPGPTPDSTPSAAPAASANPSVAPGAAPVTPDADASGEPSVAPGATQDSPDDSPGAAPYTWPPFDRPLDSYQDAEIVVPDDIKAPTDANMRYRITAKKPLYTYRGTVGRGTTVYPVEPLKGQNKEKPMVAKISCPAQTRKTLESTLIKHLRDELHEWKKYLPKIVQARVFAMEDMNYPRFKFNLPPLSREEARRLTILIMRRCKHLWELGSLEEFKDVFVDLVECHHYAYTVGKVLHRDLSENNLMWKYEEEDDDLDAYDDPEFDASVDGDLMKWFINDLLELSAYSEAEKAEKGTKKEDDETRQEQDKRDEREEVIGHEGGPKDEQGPACKDGGANGKPKAIGILSDWDLGSKVHDDGAVDRSNAQHRTGTQPFMAMELLTDTPPPHLYRHDLESFLYILIWAMVNYDLPNKRRLETGVLAEWEDIFKSNYKSKLAIMRDLASRQDLFKHVREEFKPLIGWARSLIVMFRNAFNVYDDLKDAASALPQDPVAVAKLKAFDPVTLGGRITFDTFMQALEREPRPGPPAISRVRAPSVM